MPQRKKSFGPVLFALLILSATSVAAEPPRPPIDLQGVRVVDLTYPFDEKTIYWPTSPTSFQLERLSYGKTEGGYFYSSNSFCTPEHGGTHLDAPIHFGEGKRTADQIPPEQLIAAAVVLDVAAKAAADPDYRLTLDDVRAWEAKHGTIPAGAIVLLRTGWGARWPDRKRYLGDDKPGDASNLHFPSYGAEAARFLVAERKVGALGVDTASIDHGPSKDFIVHQIANGANVPGLENVAHLEELPPTGAWVIALPVKIAGGSGGPVRIVALVPGSSGQEKVVTPDLGKVADGTRWTVSNATAEAVDLEGRHAVRLKAKGDSADGIIGLALINGLEFSTGTIEIELKGKNVRQESFLGVAFNVADAKTFEAVYFRPFNFNAEGAFKGRAVQYIAWPENTWEKLREGRPGIFEAPVHPAPDPDGWFRARIEVGEKQVRVFVEEATEPSLTVNRLAEGGKARPAGLMVDVSDGLYANFRIVPAR